MFLTELRYRGLQKLHQKYMDTNTTEHTMKRCHSTQTNKVVKYIFPHGKHFKSNPTSGEAPAVPALFHTFTTHSTVIWVLYCLFIGMVTTANIQLKINKTILCIHSVVCFCNDNQGKKKAEMQKLDNLITFFFKLTYNRLRAFQISTILKRIKPFPLSVPTEALGIMNPQKNKKKPLIWPNYFSSISL